MREIDDRYPEFAEPNEPVKKVKRHGGLVWSFFTVACVFVLAVSILNPPIKAPLTPSEPQGSQESPGSPEVQEPKSVSIQITVKSEEKEYRSEGYIITPEFSFEASDENGDVTDLVSVDLKEDTVTEAADVGEYPFGLDESSFNITAEGYDDYTVAVTDGTLTITPANVTVAVNGSTLSVEYDGKSHSVSGYSLTPDRSDYSLSDISFTGSSIASRTSAGTSYMGMTADQFSNNNSNYNVTFDVTDGYVEIRKASVTVTIKGEKDTVAYDGSAHSVSGYSTSISNSNYKKNLFKFTGKATASRTETGTSYMGLKSSQFINLDDNFSVTFKVTDGYIKITGPEADPDVPVISLLDVQDNYNMDMVMFVRVTAKIKPNKVSENGGSFTAKVYYKDASGGFVEDDEYPYEYNGDGNNTQTEISVIHRMPETVDIAHETGKLVVEYKYPDGTTDKWESEEFDMYKGSFLGLDYSYGDSGILATDNKLEVDLIFNENTTFDDGSSVTVHKENVEIKWANAVLSVFDDNYDYVEDMSVEKDKPDSAEYYTGSDGKPHLHLTYIFDDNIIPPAPYTYYTGFSGEFCDSASGWDAVVWW